MVAALIRRVAAEDPESLLYLAELREQLDAGMAMAVPAMRENGATDDEIARVFGVTRQAVSKRWPGGGRYVGAAGRYRNR